MAAARDRAPRPAVGPGLGDLAGRPRPADERGRRACPGRASRSRSSTWPASVPGTRASASRSATASCARSPRPWPRSREPSPRATAATSSWSSARRRRPAWRPKLRDACTAWQAASGPSIGAELVPVRPRILVTSTHGGPLIAARDALGFAIGTLKARWPDPPDAGVIEQVALKAVALALRCSGCSIRAARSR